MLTFFNGAFANFAKVRKKPIVLFAMDKEALLGIILSDVREVEMLLNSFKGRTAIKPAFIKLTMQKVDNIKQELEMLRDFSDIDEAPAVREREPSQSVRLEPIVEVLVPKVEARPVVVPEKDPIPKPEISDILQPEPVVVPPLVVPPVPMVEPTPVRVEPIVALPIVEEVIVEKPVAVFTEKPAPAKEQVQQVPQQKHSPTLGETLVTDKGSLFDKFQGSKESSNPALIGKPIDDIKKAIGINDRFLYQRELFGNNSDLMNQTIGELNAMDSFREAQGFIAANFNWDEHDDTTISFMNLVRRKFK
jgi:hypothetical protein